MKDSIRKYEHLFFKGEWHIHTNYTDGKNSVDDYCQKAIELKIPLIAFTEHVRKILNYNFDSLINDIKIAQKKYPELIILTGCEAKVLTDGTLDCEENILKLCDYVLFAYHSFPPDSELYFSSLKKILDNKFIDCWAHPGLFFQKHPEPELSTIQLSEIFSLLKAKNILFEINFKYNLPKEEWISLFLNGEKPRNIIFGGDIHSISQLEKTIELKKDYLKNWNPEEFN